MMGKEKVWDEKDRMLTETIIIYVMMAIMWILLSYILTNYFGSDPQRLSLIATFSTASWGLIFSLGVFLFFAVDDETETSNQVQKEKKEDSTGNRDSSTNTTRPGYTVTNPFESLSEARILDYDQKGEDP